MMMSYRNLKNKRKKIKVADDVEAVACSHNFWNEAPEDLLMEIFIRLPDSRSAVRSSTVCRRWHSSILDNPNFIELFESRNRHNMSPWNIVFTQTDFPNFSYDELRASTRKPKHFRALRQLSSPDWMFLRWKSPALCFDFLPPHMLIKGSCNDLFLMSPSLTRPDDLYICNPTTKHLVQIPPSESGEEATRVRVKGYALLPMPPSRYFKVVELVRHYDGMVQVSVFCSESRKWEVRFVPDPLPRVSWRKGYYRHIIRCDEVLFWAGSACEPENKIAYLDLSNEKCGAVKIPPFDGLYAAFEYQIGVLHVSGGVDELRLIQAHALRTREMIHLRVWSLNNNRRDDEDRNSNWFLVHKKKRLKRPKSVIEDVRASGAFVHPTNGDLVFVVWGRNVVEYNLVDDTCKKVAVIPEMAYWYNFTPFLVDLSFGSFELANTYF